MPRETLKIDKEITKEVIRRNPNLDYILVENKITRSDPEDGGADHTLIIKRKSDNKYFRIYYCDWDIDYNFDCDFPEIFSEVIPREIVTTVYE